MADDVNKFINVINFRVLLRQKNKSYAARKKSYTMTDSDGINYGLFHSLTIQSQLVEYYPNATMRDVEDGYNPHFRVLYPDSDGNGKTYYRKKSMDSIFDSDWVNNPMIEWVDFIPYQSTYNDGKYNGLFFFDSETNNHIDMYSANKDSELMTRMVKYHIDKVLSQGGVNEKIIIVDLDIFQSLFFNGSSTLKFPKLRADLQPRYRSGETHYTHAYKFGNDSDGLGMSQEFKTKWTTENTDAYNFDDDKSSDLVSVVKKLKNSQYYHGTLNGLALLAIVCGVPTTVYIPNSATLTQEQKAMKKILKNNGASIQSMENFLIANQPMDFGDNL